MTPKGKRAKKRGAPTGDARPRPELGASRRQKVLRLVCEGFTERDYLTRLEDDHGEELSFHIVLSPHKQPKKGYKPLPAVEWAVQERRRLRGKEKNNVWAVFDRDQHSDVDTAIRKAVDNGVKVAFSTPSFDLWLWLHLAPGVPPELSEDNDWVIKQLRTVKEFKDYAKQSGGRDSDDRPKRLNDTQLDKLADKKKAVELARRLVRRCPSGFCDANEKPGFPGHATNCDPLRRDTTTDIYRILEALGIDQLP
ncbi:RloB family protein [Actinomadura fulvescens]|uniref:RloB domain-containing protein n=1 Tax=Actinomadura fulvescens TaxID=46160 RepID=A0ABP6C7V2_9ACTN